MARSGTIPSSSMNGRVGLATLGDVGVARHRLQRQHGGAGSASQ
jgi:hypothetical protein